VVVTLIEWEKLDGGKWKKKGVHAVGKGKVNPYAPDYFRKLNEQMKKIFIYCDDCKKKYCLADPCIHHLSDSPEHREKYEAYIKKQKKAADKSQRINNQTNLD
jgi:hypothetical protein